MCDFVVANGDRGTDGGTSIDFDLKYDFQYFAWKICGVIALILNTQKFILTTLSFYLYITLEIQVSINLEYRLFCP